MMDKDPGTHADRAPGPDGLVTLTIKELDAIHTACFGTIAR
jgi:hypothetical protein